MLITLFLFLLFAAFAFAVALVWMFLTEILPWIIVIYVALIVLRVVIAASAKNRELES